MFLCPLASTKCCGSRLQSSGLRCYAKSIDPCPVLIAPGMACLTRQPPLARYGRNRSLLSQLMLLMLLTVTVIAGPSLLPFSFTPCIHPLCLSLSGLENAVNYYTNSSTSSICEYMPSEQCGKRPTQGSLKHAGLRDSRHSPCESHRATIHISFRLNDACSYLVSAALNLA